MIYELSETSSTGTIISLIPSPVASTASENPCFFPSLNSHNLIDLIGDNGNFNKNFTNQGVLWENSMETVYIATHRLDSHQYLVKAIPFKINLIENIHEQRIFQEINKIKQLGCRHIARYMTCWVETRETALNSPATEVLLYVQMEYITGDSLRTWLSRSFDAETSLKAIRKVGKVLKYLHSRGLPHGCISLDNIFIDKFQTVVVGDFDFTKQIPDDIKDFAEVIREIMLYFQGEERSTAREMVRGLECLRDLGIGDIIH